MEASEAVSILQCLADGVDPSTGEVYADDDPYQRPQTIRALFLAIKALERYEERQKRERTLPENAGKPWISAEDALLCQRFDAGMTIRELSQQHKRTNGSIQSRLVKLGKIEPYSQPEAKNL